MENRPPPPQQQTSSTTLNNILTIDEQKLLGENIRQKLTQAFSLLAEKRSVELSQLNENVTLLTSQLQNTTLAKIEALAKIEELKSKENEMQYKYDELKTDFEEYQEDSKTLEQELDTQLRQQEHKNKDLTACVNRLQNDNENLRSRLEQMNAEHNARTSEWTAEITAFRKTGEEINHYVRQLEQKNDDLERANRAAAMSIEDFELKLNQAIERNVYLESELDEKDNLKGMVQRLKEETRDLRYELQVSKKEQGSQVVDSNRLHCTPSPTPFNLAKAHQAALGCSTPTSSRLSPLSIVNDLLRKVGALENKLTSYPRKEDGNLRKNGKMSPSVRKMLNGINSND